MTIEEKPRFFALLRMTMGKAWNDNKVTPHQSLRDSFSPREKPKFCALLRMTIGEGLV